MKTIGVMFLVTVVAGIQLYAHDQTAEERTVLKKQTGVLAAAGKVIVEQAAKSIADYISKNLVQHSTFEVILGRTVTITRNGNSVGIKDVSSGMTISGQGSTPEEAMMNASKSYITTLLQLGFISIHDLHLAPIRTTTSTPCGDLFPSYYCKSQKQVGSCYPNSAFYAFMKHNCFGTCSGCRR